MPTILNGSAVRFSYSINFQKSSQKLARVNVVLGVGYVSDEKNTRDKVSEWK
ncbi:MAG: hypothetical protein HYU02_01160 [Thaumarchaeota archaeon]|nr:hypothetical protein [Nitrososphaerota archaeon]